MFRWTYRLLNACTPCDITQILVSARAGVTHQLAADGYELELLTAELWQELTRSEASVFWGTEHGLTLNEQLLNEIEQQTLYAMVAHRDRQAVAYVFFCHAVVPPQLNRGGSRFRGIGLQLPPDSCYLFKAYTHPLHRGRNLLPAMVSACLDLPHYQHIQTLITTTEWTNDAFLAQAQKLGFEAVGVAGEWVVGQRHLFRLPELSGVARAQGLILVPGS